MNELQTTLNDDTRMEEKDAMVGDAPLASCDPPPLPPKVQRLNGSAYEMAEQQAVKHAWVNVNVNGTHRLFPFDFKNVRFADKRSSGPGGRFYLDRLYLVNAPELGIDNALVPLHLRAPPLKNKWDFKPYVHPAKDGKKEQKSWSCDFDISTFARDRDACVAAFVSDLEQLVETTLQHLYAKRTLYWPRSESWAMDRVREQYEAVTFPVNKQVNGEWKEYEPSLRCKVKRNGGSFNAFAFDENDQRVELNADTLSANRMTVPIVEDGGIQFSADGKVKDCFTLAQVKLLPDGVIRQNVFAAPTMYTF